MPSFRVTDDSGAPITTLNVATLQAAMVYKDRTGVPRTKPAIVHLGDGIYSFTAPAQDVSDGCGYLLDLGDGSNPRRGAGFVGNAHVFFAGYDSAGAFLAGLTPTITTYKRPGNSTPASIPTVADLGSGLYAFTPTVQDRIDGVRFAIDLGASAWSRYVGGDLGEPITVVDSIVTPSVSFAPTVDTAKPYQRDLAFDFNTGKFKIQNGDLVLTQDRDAIVQAVTIRLQTFRGEWFLDVENGIPYFDQVLVKAPNLDAIQQTFKREIEGVPGIKSVTALKLTFDRGNRTLSVVWSADTDLGEISGTLDQRAA